MNQQGVTLIELVIVAAIIGLLSAISTPILSTIRANAEAGRTEAELKSINTGITMYLAEQGHYPNDITELESYVGIANIGEKYELNPSL